MFGDRQRQSGGNQSVNIQANSITFGVSERRAREIATEVFEANFLKLAGNAHGLAQDRASELRNEFFSRLSVEIGADAPIEAENPDFQAALYSAQASYARSGDKDLGNLLVQLLCERTEETERNLRQLVLNEAIEIAPKLTTEQLDALGLVFVVRHAARRAVSIRQIHEVVEQDIVPLNHFLTEHSQVYQHLVYVGCATLAPARSRFEQLIRSGYSGLFTRGISAEQLREQAIDVNNPMLIKCLRDTDRLQIDGMNYFAWEPRALKGGLSDAEIRNIRMFHVASIMSDEEVLEELRQVHSAVDRIASVWAKSLLGQLDLTSVGLALGQANWRRRTGKPSDLAEWI